jgi:hypothetical protein
MELSIALVLEDMYVPTNIMDKHIINTRIAASTHCTNMSSLRTVTIRTGYSLVSVNNYFTQIRTIRTLHGQRFSPQILQEHFPFYSAYRLSLALLFIYCAYETNVAKSVELYTSHFTNTEIISRHTLM